MSLPVPDLADVNLLGTPYHGLWRSGAITLPNGSSKSVSVVPLNGASVLIRVPGQPAVSRTTPELAADFTAGMEWRNYALLSGGYYGGAGPLSASDSYAYVLFIDGAKIPWRLRIRRHTTWGEFLVSVCRFGLIDGSTASWSSEYQVTLTVDFWGSLYNYGMPGCIAQNTAGTEFILGNIFVNTSAFQDAMCKVSVSGTVNIAAGNLGLTITATDIEFGTRPNGTTTRHDTVVGACILTSESFYYETMSPGGPTGNLYTRTVVFTDGIKTSDNGIPTGSGSAFWVLSGTSASTSTSKIKTRVITNTAKKYVWAAYVEDVLKLTWVEYSRVETYVAPAGIELISGVEYWTFSNGNLTTVTSLKSGIDSTVVVTQSQTDTAASGLDGTFLVDVAAFGADSKDGYDNTTVTTGGANTAYDIVAAGELANGSGGWYSTFLQPLPIASHRSWGNPCVVKVRRDRTGGPETWAFTTQAVVAPNANSVTTSIALASLHASWQPVLNDLRVDSVPICWF